MIAGGKIVAGIFISSLGLSISYTYYAFGCGFQKLYNGNKTKQEKKNWNYI